MTDTKALLDPLQHAANTARPHSPSQIWSYRVPSPPRVIVPPPALRSDGLPDLHIDQNSSLDFESNGFANAEFLKTVTYSDIMTVNNMIEWKYEQRRMAQQILPFLFLGPVSAARNSTFLRDNGITMVLAIRNIMSAQAKLLNSKAAVELGIECAFVDVAGNQELIAAFPKVFNVINAHLSSMYQQSQTKKAAQDLGPGEHPPIPGKVLVFCETGNERSAAVVAAYIMAMYSLDLIPALQIVQAQRFAVAYDDSLKNLLVAYGAILQAKRDVVHAGNAFIGNGHTTNGQMASSSFNIHQIPYGRNGTSKSNKRTLDEADDEMDTDEDDVFAIKERSEERKGYAPFQD